MKSSEFPTAEDIEAALARARRARSDALGSLIFRALTGRPAELLLFGFFACLLAAAVFSEPRGEAGAAADTSIVAAHADPEPRGSVIH
jgi:hypothetical protein